MTYTHFRGNRTIKNVLVSPKDKDPLEKKSEAIYWFQCGELACDEEYIGETSRTFGERFKEHPKNTSPIHYHSNITDYLTTKENFQIIGRKDHGTARIIKESIYIGVNSPMLNRNIGKFNLHHIWGRMLLNTQGLKINRQGQRTPPSGFSVPPPNTPLPLFYRFLGAHPNHT